MKSFRDYVSIKDDKKRKLVEPAWKIVEKFKDDPSVFITFTRIHKVGVNPNSEFNTVLGIYCYPLQETFTKYNVAGHQGFDLYPFPDPSDRVYVGIIKLKDANDTHFIHNVVENYTNDMYLEDKEKLKQIYTDNELYELPYMVSSLKSPIKYSYETLCKITDTEAMIDGEPAHEPAAKMWNLTRHMGIMLSVKYKSKNAGESARYSRQALKWNTILRSLNYHGFSDYGWGLLHPNEPIQAVHLSMKHIDIVDIIPNHNYIELSDEVKEIFSHTDDYNYYTDEATQAQAKNTIEFVTTYKDYFTWILNYKKQFINFERVGSNFNVAIGDGNITGEDIVIKDPDVRFAYNFYRTHLTNCNFDYSRIGLYDCTCVESRLVVYGANTSIFDNCEVSGAALTQANMKDCTFKNGTYIKNIHVSEGVFISDETVKADNCILRRTDITLHTAHYCNFLRARLNVANFEKCVISDSFSSNDDAVLNNCTFTATDLSYVQNFKGKVNHAIRYNLSQKFLDIFSTKVSPLEFDSPYSPSDLMKVINTRYAQKGATQYTQLFTDEEDFHAATKELFLRHPNHYDRNAEEE